MPERIIYHNPDHIDHKGWVDTEGKPWDVPDRLFLVVDALLSDDTSRTEWLVVPEFHQDKYAKMDLILSVVADARSHAINLEYDASKFDQNYMSAVAKVFLNITKSIVENAHQPIKDIPLIDTDETKDLLAIGSGETKKIAPPFVWNRFKMTARNNFESTAIKDKSKSITYKELFEMSCRYAELLAERGVTTSSVVGVHMERSADYIASMLAIWSLGAVYVPLDTKQPTSRITYMIKQAGISAVVTRRNNKNIDSDIMRCDIEDSVDMKPRNSSYEPTGEDMAYVIFTSGSTGTPKGVMIEHRGFLNHLEIMIEDLNLSKNDVIAQTAPVSFDISVWQLICALMVGASIVIVDHGDLIDPDQMHQIIKKDGISVLEVVPSLLSGYLSAEESNSRLRGQFEYVKVITTGEAISGSIVEQWITHYPNQPLLNAYGPAEASDDTHFFDIQGSAVDSARSIPIGRSLLNIQTYVVNQDMQLLPKGVVGEICIGGLAVAKGYIGSEELTAKSFLPNPFSEKEQSRLYRTGDYGKWREDNLLEYHGRRDHQVKVRGQRLELGEVEERLKKVSGVKDAAVIAERSPSGARLRGYIVSHHPDVSTEGVKTQLGLMLPDYMVPWKIEIIPSLPRTGNGKLDRRTLEAYSNTNNDSSLSNKASESLSKLLQQIVQVYSSVLNTDIKHNSNYFDFGGDSLLSMKIVAMLEKKNIHVGIRDILMHQTPEELALSVSKKQDAKLLGAESWPILDGLTPIQDYYLENTGKKYRDNGDVQAAILTVGYETDLDDGSLLSALNKIMNIHEELRPIEESTPLVVQSNAIQAKKQDTAVLVDEMRIKVSLRNPLVGCVLSEAGKKSVLLVAHHYVLDFYSWSLIEEELKAFLEGGTKTIKENVLKKWWGKTLSDLTNDKSKLDDAIRFWQPAHDQLHNMETVDGDTKHFTYSHSLPESIVKGLSKEGVSLESFSYFAIIKAQLATSGKVSFSYNIESSIRSIDDTGVLGKGVGWMTYLFPQKFEEGSLSTISLGDFHKMNVDAIRRGYEYGLLRYKILPKQFKDRSVPIWTMNYLGKSMEHTGDVTILQSRPMKEGPFIEVDISHDDEQITFQYFHNTALSKDDFDAMDEELSTVIKGLASQTMQKKMSLSAQRQKAILERLKHAG